jgi:hypothetical protein
MMGRRQRMITFRSFACARVCIQRARTQITSFDLLRVTPPHRITSPI